MTYRVKCDRVTTIMDDRLFELETGVGTRYVGKIDANTVTFSDVPSHVMFRVQIYNTTEYTVKLNGEVMDSARPILDAGNTGWIDRSLGQGYGSILSELLTAGIVQSKGVTLAFEEKCPDIS